MAISPPTVMVNFTDSVMLIFQAALDSNGISNEISVLIVEQKDTNGVSVRNRTATQDSNNPQIFFIEFQVALGSLTGTYSACKYSALKYTCLTYCLQTSLSFPQIRLKLVSTFYVSQD